MRKNQELHYAMPEGMAAALDRDYQQIKVQENLAINEVIIWTRI